MHRVDALAVADSAAGVIHEGDLSVIDRVVDQPVRPAHRWRLPGRPHRPVPRPRIDGGIRRATVGIRDRVVWLVAFPFYLLFAAVVTILFVIASIVVELLHAIRRVERPLR
jgi:hypothetical protein